MSHDIYLRVFSKSVHPHELLGQPLHVWPSKLFKSIILKSHLMHKYLHTHTNNRGGSHTHWVRSVCWFHPCYEYGRMAMLMFGYGGTMIVSKCACMRQVGLVVDVDFFLVIHPFYISAREFIFILV